MSDQSKVETIEPPEHSLPLRVISLLMTLICLTAANVYTQVPLFLGFLYIWFAITGSYVSYYIRDNRPKWLIWAIGIGLIVVMSRFGNDLVSQYHAGKLEGLTPFIHVLAGLLTLHTFDLRARSDINISTLIALGLFACTAVLGRDLPFGFYVSGLVILSTILLYFESVARTKAGEGSQNPAPAIMQDVPQRAASGSALLPICALPALALFLFLTLPRVDSFFDLLAARFHTSSLRLSDSGLSGLAGGGLFGGTGHNAKGDGEAGSGGNGGQGSGGENGKNKGTKGKGSGEKASTQNKQGGAAPGGADKGQGKGKAKEQSQNQGAGDKAENKNAPDNAKKNAGGKGQDQGQDKDEAPFGGGMPKSKPKMVESDQLMYRDKDAATHDKDIFMTVRCKKVVFLKRMAFDYYDGRHWKASLHAKPAICERINGEWAELGGVPSLFVPANIKGEDVEQEVTCEIPLGQVIPAASVPQRIDIGKEQISVDEYGVLRCKSGLPEDITFRIISKLPAWDLNQLRQKTNTPVEEENTRKNLGSYLQLPEKLPQEVPQLAKKIVEGESTWFGKAERICKYLRYHYKYSFEPYKEDKEHDLVADFLFHRKEGACNEFSSAFVVMCRAAGIPARCVGGFGPGDLNVRTGVRQIRGKDGHAWGEIFVPDAGWVPFDATPTGTMPEPPREENPFISSVKQIFQAASIAFEASQMDRQIGKGSEQSYEVRMKEISHRGARPSGPISPVNVDLAPKPGAEISGAADDRDGMGLSTDSANGKKSNSKGHNKNFSVSWQLIAGCLALIPFIYLVLKAILARWGEETNNPRMVKGVKPATLLYLKLVEDLKRMKILRRPSDTPDELTQRFFDILDSGQVFHPELPGLFKEFINIYSAERFSSQGYSAENYKQLREIGSKIHSLSRGRYTDKS
jgi:Transglutaminase-like superfamily/TgpA N-terminal domain